MGSPEDAPPRTDLPYLRHRRRPAVAPPEPVPVRAAGGDLLDLGTPTAPAVPPRSDPPPAVRRRLAPVRRVAPDRPLALTPPTPTAVLTRIQSGVGTLTATMHWSEPGVGRLLVACQRRSREVRVLNPEPGSLVEAGGLLLDHRGGSPSLTWDLLHVREIDRLMLAVTANRGPRPLTGVLTLVTYSGARVEVPVELPPEAMVSVLVTIFQVDGELVLRAERDTVGATLKDACDAYGYGAVTWINPYTPMQ
ncbi:MULTISPECIES: hypothetical protein [Actinoplanes]|uniref:hypothetical protein n=1 Tax=Actinoplanes TaxID=1865 RepID=UPI0005F2F5D9|nr:MULTISPECIES: hypothetical protein [Actinoplanes]GLY07716.1 hypothetical protein Acsp01_80950 [Actinoplanes sp. NBRC 101535]